MVYRGSEILFSLANAYVHRHSVKNFLSKEVTDALTSVRRQLGLFQHHDAIAGTARDFVVVDYGIRCMHTSIFCIDPST
jgi:alpha-mannosidase II